MAQNKTLSFILEELQSGFFNNRYLGHDIEDELKTELFNKICGFVENYDDDKRKNVLKKVLHHHRLTKDEKRLFSFFLEDVLEILNYGHGDDDED